MRSAASFDPNKARASFLEEREHASPRQTLADDYIAFGINAMDLEDRLRDIQTDCCGLHGRFLSLVTLDGQPKPSPVSGRRGEPIFTAQSRSLLFSLMCNSILARRSAIPSASITSAQGLILA